MNRIKPNSIELSVRAVFLLFICAILICIDVYFAPFKMVRFYLDTLISPLHSVSHSPQKINDYLYTLSLEKSDLLQENQQLKEENLYIKAENKQLQNLENENQKLRNLLNAPISKDNSKKVAQVLQINTNPFAFQIVLDQGESEGIFNNQPIADENGLLGQVFQVALNTSRAILICDYQHAISVRNTRNEMTMIAQGNGCGNDLILDFLPTSADIEIGDELVSSGLDGIFPANYPVATVAAVRVDQNRTVPLIYATPKANIKQLRYVLLLWNEKFKSTLGDDVTAPLEETIEQPSSNNEEQNVL